MSLTASSVASMAKDHWSDSERHNVELTADFVRLVMNEHDFETARQRYDNGAYLQHSRGIPDGIEGLIGYLQNLTKRYPEYQYDVRHIHADGEYVTFHSHATLKAKHRGDDGQGLNIIDTWRIVDDQIVEHWDAIQPLSTSMRLLALIVGGRAKNSNSIF